MVPSRRDFLSLLMERERARSEAARAGDAAGAPAPEVTDPETRPAAPRTSNRARPTPPPGLPMAPTPVKPAGMKSAAPKAPPVRVSDDAVARDAVARETVPSDAPRAAPHDPTRAPRVHVEPARHDPITLGQLAKEPIPTLKAPSRVSLSPVAITRLVVYPLLLIALVAVGMFAASRLGGGQRSSGAGPENNEGAPTPGALGNSAKKDLQDGLVGDPANATPGSGLVPGNAGTSSDGGIVEGRIADGRITNASSAPRETAPGDSAAGPSHPHVIRAATYPDTPEGMESANTAVSGLRQRGFSDARAIRLPRDKEGRRFDVVILVGRGESARDRDLLSLGERLRPLPGFGPGQAKQRPFSDSFIMRQPEADQTNR